MALNPDDATRKKTADQFFQSSAGQKYAAKVGTPGSQSYYEKLLSSAQRDDNGNWVLYGWGGRPLNMPTKLSDFGSEFEQLGKDYSAWIDQMTKSNEEYSNYVGLVKANPGRDQTILGGQVNSSGGTLLGSTRQTVFGL